MSEGFVAGWRLFLVGIVTLAGFGAAGYRLVHLHLVDGPRLAARAQDNREKLLVRHARRGNLVDRRGQVLAGTVPLHEVGLDPQSHRPEDDAKLPALADLLDVPLATIREALGRRLDDQELAGVDAEGGRRAVRWVKLHAGVTDDVYAEVRALGIKAVYGNRLYERTYPGGSLAAHVLGFVNKEGTATSGAEAAFDFYLRGQDGWVETEKDGRRRELARFRSREIPSQDGLGVELTIDSVVQDVAEREVERLVAEYKPAGVSILVSEPATGAILAMANHPTFDPNHFNTAPIDALRNRAVTDVFEPGSTFKIVAIAGALEEGLVRPDTVIDCTPESVEYNGRVVRLPRESSRFGKAPVSEIAARSSNRGAARLGMMLGDQRMYAYSASFGFGEPAGWQAGAEVRGILNPVERWDGLTISRLPMGHAVAATPLQVHLAMSVLANGGVLMAPRLVRRSFDDLGATVVAWGPYARHRVVSPATARTLSGLLVATASSKGTAAGAEIPSFEVAGKTGTTQKLVDGRYSSEHHVASFSGFFPASAPRLVITVIVDQPELPGPGYGGRVSAPAFKNIAEQLIQYLAIQPVRGPDSPQGPLVAGSRRQP